MSFVVLVSRLLTIRSQAMIFVCPGWKTDDRTQCAEKSVTRSFQHHHKQDVLTATSRTTWKLIKCTDLKLWSKLCDDFEKLKVMIAKRIEHENTRDDDVVQTAKFRPPRATVLKEMIELLIVDASAKCVICKSSYVRAFSPAAVCSSVSSATSSRQKSHRPAHRGVSYRQSHLQGKWRPH